MADAAKPAIIFKKRPKTDEGGAARAAAQPPQNNGSPKGAWGNGNKNANNNSEKNTTNDSRPTSSGPSNNNHHRRSPKPQGESASAAKTEEGLTGAPASSDAKRPLTLKKRDKSKEPLATTPIVDPAVTAEVPTQPDDTVGTPPEATTPAEAPPKPKAAPAPAQEQCDLCQLDVPTGTLEAHVCEQHSGLINRITQLTMDVLQLKANPVKLDTAMLESFGRFIEADVLPSDQGEAVFKRALAAHDQVSRLVQRRFPTCQVYVFGSSVAMGSWDGSGDIDMTLVDAKGWDRGTWPPKGDSEGQTIVRLAGICREGGFSHDDLEPLRRVRVPVLKHKRPFKLDLTEHAGYYEILARFNVNLNANQRETVEKYFAGFSEGGRWRDPSRYIVRFKTGLEAFEAYMKNHKQIPTHTVFWASFTTAPEMFGIDFDLSCRAHGIRNSWLLRKYMEQSSLVRAGSVFLKYWSKNSGVNYSMKGYFTSYAINILWVNFLLKRNLVKFVDPIKDVEGSAEKSPVTGSYIPLIAAEERDSPAFLQRVAETVYDFFCYYAYEFDWEADVVSICREGPTTKESLGWTQDKEVRTGGFRDRVWYRLCIEDPFEANLNLGRHASTPKALKIRSQFFRAALLIAKGDYKAVLVDNTTMAGVERLQRVVPRQMFLHQNNMTYKDLVEAVVSVDPDALAAMMTEYTIDKLPGHCGCTVEDDDSITPTIMNALVNANAGDLVKETDEAVAAAGAFGLPVAVLHDVNNLHPLYFSSVNSKRLFAASKHMRRYDEHQREIMALLPSTKDGILSRIREKVPRVDVNIVEYILKDSRFISFDGATKTYTVSKKAAEAAKNQKDGMDLTSKQLGSCDECNRRAPVYLSIKGGKAKYCEPCWESYLNSMK